MSRTTHGDSYSRLYGIYSKMKQRCESPRNENYYRYGARGIKVCDEWHEYEPFRDWALANGYADNLSIDRIDNNGNYEPSNCRWATVKQQSNNRSNSVYLTYNGETHTMAEWCDIRGLKYKTVSRRYFTGKTMDEILSKESLRHGRNQARATS